MAVPLGRGPKLNTLAEEDNEALDKARREWLRRLEAPRGKASGSMPHAVWDPERCAAKVTRTKGRDLSLLGYPEKGEMWLRPEEMLCLVEDSLLALYTAAGASLSVQEAYMLVLGGPKPPLIAEVYTCFAHLYRANFICRPRAIPAAYASWSPTWLLSTNPAWGCSTASSSSTAAASSSTAAASSSTAAASSSTAAASSSSDAPTVGPKRDPLALFDVYHKQGYARRKAQDGELPPEMVMAVYRLQDIMPSPEVLKALADSVAPLILRCACVHQQDVMYFEPSWPIEGNVHTPKDIDGEEDWEGGEEAEEGEEAAAAAAAMAAMEEATVAEGAAGGSAAASSSSAGQVVVQPPEGQEACDCEPFSRDSEALPPVELEPPSAPPSPPVSPPPSPPPAAATATGRGGGLIISGEDEEEEEEEEDEPPPPPPPKPSAMPPQQQPPAMPTPQPRPKEESPMTPPPPPPVPTTSGAAAAEPPVEEGFWLPPRPDELKDDDEVAAAPATPPPPPQPPSTAATPPSQESWAQQRLRRLTEQATAAIRQSLVTHGRGARTQLESTSLSATRAANCAEAAAALREPTCAKLQELKGKLDIMALRDDEDPNVDLWPQ